MVVAVRAASTTTLDLTPVVRRTTPTTPLAPVLGTSALSMGDTLRLQPQSAAKAVIDRAAQICSKTLDGNVWDITVQGKPKHYKVILTGTGKFDALWTRDGMFSCMGLMASGRMAPVKDTLTCLLDHQFDDGYITRRIGPDATEVNTVLQVFGIHRKRKHNFKMVDRANSSWWTKSPVIPPDGCLLVPVVMAEYVQRSGDQAFLAANWTKLQKAMAWIQTQVKDGLVVQTPVSDWKDIVNRGKVTLYNQAIYFKTLHSMADMADRMGDPAQASVYREMATALTKRVHDAYWDDQNGYFRDSETYAGFSSDSNLLAVGMGLASKAEAERVFQKCDELMRLHGPILPANEKPYPKNFMPLAPRLFGMQHYHDTMEWPWLTCMYSIAATRMGDTVRAERALAAVASVYAQNGGVHEIYEGTPPKPVHKLFYKAETGFSWASGTFLQAKAELEAARRQSRPAVAVSLTGD